MDMTEYSDDLTEYGSSDVLYGNAVEELLVPNNPLKDTSINIMLGEDNIDLQNITPTDDIRDFGNFSAGDYFPDDKQIENYLATFGLEDQTENNGNTYQTLQPLDSSASLYEMPSPPPQRGMMNRSDPTLPSMITPPVQTAVLPLAPAQVVQAGDTKPRGRKSAHVVKPCSPPTYPDSLPSSPMTPLVKQEIVVAEPRRAPVKRKKAVSTSSSNTLSSVPATETEDAESKPKKPKMHERPFDPKAKNAVAAKRNREKKKSEEQRLKVENDILSKELSDKDAEIQEIKNDKLILENQLKIERARCQSLQGLARVTKSASSILDMVVRGIFNGTGEKYSVEFPNWFQQAPGNPEHYATQEFLQVGKTSSFITLHVSQEEKRILVDYTPIEPQISHDIPVPQ